MSFGDFWIQQNNLRKERLQAPSEAFGKERLEPKFAHLFDFFDKDRNGKLNAEEMEFLSYSLSAASGDNILTSAESKTSIFSDLGEEKADFLEFVKAISDAVKYSKTEELPNGEKRIITEYKNGIKDTIYYYPNGDFKFKVTEKKNFATIDNPETELRKMGDGLSETRVKHNYKKVELDPDRFVYLSEQATQEVQLKNFVFQHFIDTNTDAQKAIDSVEWLDRAGNVIKEGLEELGLGKDTNNLSKMEDGIKSNKSKVDDLGQFVDTSQYSADLYFGKYEDKFKTALKHEYSPEQAAAFQELTNQYQTATYLNQCIDLISRALRELDNYETDYYQQQNQMPGDNFNPMSHINTVIETLTQLFDDKEIAEAMVNQMEMDNHGKFDISDLVEQLKEMLNTNKNKLAETLGAKESKFEYYDGDGIHHKSKISSKAITYEELKEKYIQEYKSMYNVDTVPEEVLDKVMTSKEIGGIVKIAMIMAIQMAITKQATPVLAAGGAVTEGAAALKNLNAFQKVIQGLIKAHGVQKVSSGLNFAVQAGFVPADIGLGLVNGMTSKEGLTEEKMKEVFIGGLHSAKYVGFGYAVTGRMSLAITQNMSKIGLGTRLFNGIKPIAKGQKVIKGADFVSKLNTGVMHYVGKGAAFVADGAAFGTFDALTGDLDLAEATENAFKMQLELGVARHFLETLLGVKVHARIAEAKQRANVKTIDIIEDTNGAKPKYIVQNEGKTLFETEDIDAATAQVSMISQMGIENYTKLQKKSVKISPEGQKILDEINEIIKNGTEKDVERFNQLLDETKQLENPTDVWAISLKIAELVRGNDGAEEAVISEETNPQNPATTSGSGGIQSFAEISNDFAQNHKSYELYSDNDGNNVVMIVAVAGERPNSVAGIPFTYEVYRFDKDGNQISEPLKGLSEKEAKKYQLENKQFIDNRVSDNSSTLNSFIIPLPKKILESINDFINRNHERYKYNKELKKLLIGGASEDFVAQQKEELLKAFSQAPKELQDEVRNATPADLGAKLKVAKLIEKEFCAFRHNGELVTLENYERLEFNGSPDGNFVTKIIADVTKDNVLYYLERINNLKRKNFEDLPVCYFGKNISLDNFKKMQSEGVDIRMSRRYVHSENGEFTLEYDVAEYQKLFEQINDDNIDFIIDVYKRTKENHYTLDPKGYSNALDQLNNGDKDLIRKNVDVVEFLACRDIKEQITSENLPILKAISKNNEIGKEEIPKILKDVAADGQAKVIERLNTGLKYERAKYLSELTPEMKTIEDKLEGFDKLPEEELNEKQTMIKNNKINRARKFLDEYPSIREDDKRNIIELLENTKTYEQFNARYDVFEFHKEKMAGYSQEGNYWGPTHMVEFLNMIKIKEQAELINQTGIDLFTGYRTLNDNFGRTYINCSNHFEELNRSGSQWSSRNEIRKALGEAKFEDDILALKEGVSDEVLNNDNYSSLVTDPIFRDVYRNIKKCRDYTKEQELDIRAILRKPKTASEVLKSNPKLKSVKEISNQVIIETVKRRVQSLIEQFDKKETPKMERWNSKETNLNIIEQALKSFQNFDGVVENLSKYNTQTLELLQEIVRGLDESSFNEVSDILKNGDFSNLELRSGVDNLLEYFKRGLSTEHDRIYAKLMLMSDAEYRNTLIILSKRPEILTQKIDPATFDRLIKMSDSEYLDYITPESERPIKPIDIEAYRKEVLSSIDPDYKVDLSVYEQNVLAESSARDIGKFTARRSCSPDELRAETTRKAKESRQVHSVEEYIEKFEKTGNVTVTMQDRGGLKPEYTDEPIIKPEDVENLGIPQSADMTLGMGETRNWDNQRLARDLLQNFYDGNGFTLEGVEIKVEKQTNGKYKVRISGKGEFDYDRLVTLGFSGKRDLARSAGRHGEGAKVINGNLLCNKGTDSIEFGCGDWKLTLTKGDKAFDPNNKNATTPVMKTLTKNETKVEGNYMEFETTDPEFVKAIIKAKDFYYNAENTDFINPDVDNEFMTVKFHDNYREGNLYVIQRYEVEGSQGFDNALPGVSIAFKVNPEHPQIIKNNYGQKLTLSSGRNRVGLTEEKVTELIRAYGKTLTDEQLTNIIGHMEGAFKVKRGLFGYDLSARTPMQFILKGFLDVIKDRHLKIDFENRDYVAVPEGTTQSELEFVLKLGKTPVIGEMQSAGVPEIGVYMREVEAKRVPIVNITEAEKAKIQLLDKATQLFSENLDLDESSIITSREASSPKYVFEQVGNDNYAAGEAILSGNSYKAHWVERNYLNNNSFYDILATWLHEISHKTGGDGSYGFVERLEKLEELITQINVKNPNFSKQLSVIAEEYGKLSEVTIEISNGNNKEFDLTNYEHQIEMLMKHIEFHKDDYVEKEVETTEKNPEFHINNPLADSKKVKKGEYEREFIHPEKNIEVRGAKVISGDIPGSSREFTTDIIATSNLKTLKETGRLSVELPKPNGINPVKGSTKIAETDRALLGQAKKTNMLLSYNQYQEWTYEMAARDIYQNFYDGHGGTLDGVKLEIVKQPNGKYKVKLSGESEYNYFYLQYTSASTKPSTDCAGGFGEGAKMSSRALLRSEAIDKITFGSGDWSMDFTRQEGVPIDNAFMMRTLRENSVPQDGTFVEFETDNLNLIEAMIRAKDYFEHSENPDFQDLDYKNKAFAYKVLPPGERGNLYYLQRFAVSTDGELEGALNGLELIFNEKISREDLKKLKLNDDCDRLGFTPKEMRKIADYYAKSMSDEELMQTISDLEHFIYTDSENSPHLNSPEAQFVFGLIDNACKRESRPYFDDESKFVCLQQGTDPEDIDFAQKHGYVVLSNEAMRLGFSNVDRIVSLHKEVQPSTKGIVEMQKIGLLEEALYAFGIDRKIETFDYKSSEGDVRSWANGDKFYVNLDYLKKVDFYTILNQLLCKSVYDSDRISYGYNLTTLLGKHFKTFVNSPQTREKLQCIEQQYNNIE